MFKHLLVLLASLFVFSSVATAQVTPVPSSTPGQHASNNAKSIVALINNDVPALFELGLISCDQLRLLYKTVVATGLAYLNTAGTLLGAPITDEKLKESTLFSSASTAIGMSAINLQNYINEVCQ